MARSADLDGLAVVWGLTNKKPNAEACADACRRHEPPGVARGGPYGALPCNAFTFCPVEFDQCFEADAHTMVVIAGTLPLNPYSSDSTTFPVWDPHHLFTRSSPQPTLSSLTHQAQVHRGAGGAANQSAGENGHSGQ